jgi:hypothetical protein
MEFCLLRAGVVVLYSVIKPMLEPLKQKAQQTNRTSSENRIRATMARKNRLVANSKRDDYDFTSFG